jgi:hypothetical protein
MVHDGLGRGQIVPLRIEGRCGNDQHLLPVLAIVVAARIVVGIFMAAAVVVIVAVRGMLVLVVRTGLLVNLLEHAGHERMRWILKTDEGGIVQCSQNTQWQGRDC